MIDFLEAAEESHTFLTISSSPYLGDFNAAQLFVDII